MYDSQKRLFREKAYRPEPDWNTFVRKMNKTDISVIDMLNNTNPDAKEEFLADEGLSKPKNAYGQLDIKRVGQNIETILSLKKELESPEIPEKKRAIAALILEDNLKKTGLCMPVTFTAMLLPATGPGRPESIKKPT